VVADVSFISLRLAVPPLVSVAAEWADFVVLVKPQFEARPEDVRRGGVVRDPEVWRRAIDGVAAVCADAGAAPVCSVASPLPGPAGNVEFFVHATRRGADATGTAFEAAVTSAIEEGRRIGGLA
jgi:23S rRNA (cytidine1920-2'-O)/16S rRNA (cytidine1409-2'-O)-methyltransferase